MMTDKINWPKITGKLPVKLKDPRDKQARLKIWNKMDFNGNGYLSLAEVDKGMRDVLQSDKLFDAKPAILRAFQFAKNHSPSQFGNKYSQDYIEKREFRVFMVALRQRFEYLQAFKRIDVGGDGRIDFKEFKNAQNKIETWVGKFDPKIEFQKIDKNGGGQILFDEFCEWSLQKSLDLEDDDDFQDKNIKNDNNFQKPQEIKQEARIPNQYKYIKRYKASQERLVENQILDSKNLKSDSSLRSNSHAYLDEYPTHSGYQEMNAQVNYSQVSFSDSQAFKRNFPAKDDTDCAEIPQDLFERLVQCCVLKISKDARQDHESQTVTLDKASSEKFQNGMMFLDYMMVLKDKSESAEGLNFDQGLQSQIQNENLQGVKSLQSKRGESPYGEVTVKKKQTSIVKERLRNWNLVCAELPKHGIEIDQDQKSLYVAGVSEDIVELFTKLEQHAIEKSRDQEILDFSEHRIDIQSTFQSEQDQPYSDQNITSERKSPKFDSKSNTMTTNAMAQSYVDKMVNKNEAVAKGDLLFEEKAANYKDSPKKTKRGRSQSNQVPKNVQNGVDILKMTSDILPSETNSSLEFILNTLCRAFSLEPKQAAALLTNNNYYLIHICIKGIKNQYEPVQQWYTDLFQYSKYLSKMLQVDVKSKIDEIQKQQACLNFTKVLQTLSSGCYSLNPKITKLCLKVLGVLAIDFSNDVELYQICINWVNDYHSHVGGCFALNQTLKRQSGGEISKEYVKTIMNFTQSEDSLIDFFTNTLSKFYQDEPDEYFSSINNILEILMTLINQSGFSHELFHLLVQKSIDIGGPLYHKDNKSKIAAINLLADIWMTDFQMSEDHQNLIIQTFRENLMSRTRDFRIINMVNLFKILEKLAPIKHKLAPQIFKILIQSVIQNPTDMIYREVLLTNFLGLFKKIPSIPVQLLVDPLIKISQNGKVYQYFTFDFEFLRKIVEEHPKLTIQSAVLMIKFLQVEIIEESVMFKPGIGLITKVFERFQLDDQIQQQILKMVTRYLEEYIKIFGKQFPKEQQNMKIIESEEEQTVIVPAKGGRRIIPSSSQKKNLLKSNYDYGEQNQIQKLQHPRHKSMANLDSFETVKFDASPEPSQISKEFSRINSQLSVRFSKENESANFDDSELDARLNKALIINTISRLIEVLLKNQEQLGYFQDKLVDTLLQHQFLFEKQKRQMKKMSKSIKSKSKLDQSSRSQGIDSLLLQIFKNDQKQVDDIFYSYKQSKQDTNSNNLMAIEPLKSDNPYEIPSLEIVNTGKRQLADLSHKSGKYALSTERYKNPQTQDTVVSNGYGMLKQLSARKLDRSNVSARTLRELDDIKRIRQEQESRLSVQRASSLARQTKNKSKLSQELQRRRVLLGVPENRSGVKQEVKAVIVKPQDNGEVFKFDESDPKFSIKQSQRASRFDPAEQLKSKVQIINLQDEDPHDRKAIVDFMKQYQKLWKTLYRTYSNTALGADSNIMTIKDISRILRDHNIFKQLINFDEIQQVLRKTGQHEEGKIPDLSQIPYDHFLKFINQVGFLCFSRAPNDFSNQPLLTQLQKMVDYMEKAALSNNLATKQLFKIDHQDDDQDLLDELNAKFQDEKDEFVVPDGYKKVVEKVPTTIFQVPQILREARGPQFISTINEEFVIGTELVDEILFSAVGIHFLEPTITYEEQEIIKKDRNVSNPKTKSRAKLPLNMRLEITKKPQAEKQDFSNVAELLDEMINQIDKGPKKPNQALENRKELSELAAAEQQKKEYARKQRDKRIKEQIKQNIPKKEEQEKKLKEDEKEQKQKAKDDIKDFQKKAEALRKKVDQANLKKQEEITARLKEEKVKGQAQRKKDLISKKEFYERQKQELEKSFVEKKKARELVEEQQERNEELESQITQNFGRQRAESLRKERSRADSIGKYKQSQAIKDLIQNDESIKKVFEEYENLLQLLVKYFGMQGTDQKVRDKDGFGNLEQKTTQLNQKEFAMLCTQRGIVPDQISPDDLVYVFKSCSNEKSQVGFEDFKNALVKICALTQNKLKKQEETQNLNATKKSAKDPTLIESLKKKKAEKIQKLRDQFLEEQKAKEEATSKAPKQGDKQPSKQIVKSPSKLETKSPSQQKGKSPSKEESKSSSKEAIDKNDDKPDTKLDSEKQSISKNKLKLNERIEMQREQRQEVEFQKWLKQRENLGIDNDDVISTSTISMAKSNLNSKKDLQTKQMKDLSKYNKELEKLGKIKFDDSKNFGKNVDPAGVSGDKIKELIESMGLGENLSASESEIFKHLQNNPVNRNKSRLSVSKK